MHKYPDSGIGRIFLHGIAYLIMAGFLIPEVSAQSALEIRAKIDQIIRFDLDSELDYTPVFIVGIIDNDSTYFIHFGEKTRTKGDTIATSDFYELGGLTKIYTGQIVLGLSQQGMIDLNQPVNRYLPEMYQNPLVAATPGDLLLHFGSLPHLPPPLDQKDQYDADLYSDFSRRDLMEWYRDFRPDSNGTFKYSNTGYAILEVIIEYTTGRRFADVFDDFIEEKQLRSGASTRADVSLSPGYDLSGRKMKPRQFLSFAGSGAARGSMSDLTLLIRYLLDLPDAHPLWNMTRAMDTKGVKSAPGLFCFYPRKRVQVWMHAGQSSGHHAIIALNRQTRTGVAILANSSAGTGDLGLLILKMLNKHWKRKAP